jgi:uncharacterized OB-fold protein
VPDPKAASVLIPKVIKSESDIMEELYWTKKKYKNYDVYIFECINCSLFMMLHQEFCPHCNRKNTYFDNSFKVN